MSGEHLRARVAALLAVTLALDVLQAYAISVVAILAGSFGAFFHRRGMEREPS